MTRLYCIAAWFEDSDSDGEVPDNRPYFKLKDAAKGPVTLPNGYVVDCSGDHFVDPINDPWELYKLQFHRGELCSYARKDKIELEREAARGLSIVRPRLY